MSKASEWAKAMQESHAAQPKDFRDPRQGTDQPGPYLGLRVDDGGRCVLLKNGSTELWLPPEVATAAARWILDTFGEAGA